VNFVTPLLNPDSDKVRGNREIEPWAVQVTEFARLVP